MVPHLSTLSTASLPVKILTNLLKYPSPLSKSEPQSLRAQQRRRLPTRKKPILRRVSSEVALRQIKVTVDAGGEDAQGDKGEEVRRDKEEGLWVDIDYDMVEKRGADILLLRHPSGDIILFCLNRHHDS